MLLKYDHVVTTWRGHQTISSDVEGLHQSNKSHDRVMQSKTWLVPRLPKSDRSAF